METEKDAVTPPDAGPLPWVCAGRYGDHNMGPGARKDQVRVLNGPVPSSVTLGNLLCISEPALPHLPNETDRSRLLVML